MPMVSDAKLAQLIARNDELQAKGLYSHADIFRELQLYREVCRRDRQTYGFIIREWVSSKMDGWEDSGDEEAGEGS